MREITLNGYIDECVWFGDEITPESLHGTLYGQKNEFVDDVHIRLNSFGGSCNAAVRMHDDIRAYPGEVRITVSGTAASATTVLAMAADELMMTPGSLWLVHDPSTFAWGNERDLGEAVNLLRACKESILNVYCKRCKKSRADLSDMMAAATWMDANQALAEGFIDGIAGDTPANAPENAARRHTVDRTEAEAKVQAWLDRRKPHGPQASKQADDGEPMKIGLPGEPAQEPQGVREALETGGALEARDTPPEIQREAESHPSGTPIAQLEHRLGLIMPTRRE